jgi:hypothetical protein
MPPRAEAASGRCAAGQTGARARMPEPMGEREHGCFPPTAGSGAKGPVKRQQAGA